MNLKLCVFTATIVLFLTVSTTRAKGGGGGRGGGSVSGGGGGRGSGKSSVAKKVAVAGALGGTGGLLLAAAATKSGKGRGNFINDQEAGVPDDGVVVVPGNGIDLPLYNTPQEVRSYYKRDGPGMSAFGIIVLILAIVGAGSLTWFCYTVGLPMWRERNRKHSLMLEEPLRRHEGLPLHETPSTATPSP